MLEKFRVFIRNNAFAIALWSAIGVLLVLSVHRNAPVQALGAATGGGGGNGSGQDFCDLIADIDDFFCGEDVLPAGANLGKTNVRFEPNVGQGEDGYGFLAHGRGQIIHLSATDALFELKGSKKVATRQVHATLEGSNKDAVSRADIPLSGRVNYLIGGDPTKWHTDIPTFGSVTFSNIYPNIDVVYHGFAGEIENDFLVRPGGDTDAIRIQFSGADNFQIEGDGSLSVHADQRVLSWKKPLLYQVGAHGMRSRVEGHFKVTNDGAIGFEVGVYDATRPLVIDPPLTYATYFGSPETDAAGRVAADNSGNAYIIGGTDDEAFPSTPGTYVSNKSGLQGQVLVAKLSANGQSMIWETHIGGSNGDIGYGIALDSSQNVYLTGMTASADYPLVPATNNYTTKSIVDPMNCFVTELNAAGNALVYSATLGGSQVDGCSSVGVDSAGNTYVAGVTDSSDFPTANAFQSALPPAAFGNPSYAAFVTKFSPGASSILYSTFYGTAGNTAATSIAVDGPGNVYFTGFTTSSTFPTTSSAYQQTFGGSGGQTNSVFTTGDAILVKLNPSGQRVYATLLGGAKDDIGVSVAIDSSGDAYIGGATLSSNFPVTSSAFQSKYAGAGGSQYAQGGDGFIAEIDPTGSNLLFSSYIGGPSDDRVLAVALDSSNNIYLAGHTLSMAFPTTGQQAQQGYAGDSSGIFKTGDAFVAEVSGSSHTLTFSTFLGGSGGDWAGGVAIDGTGGIIVSGGTSSNNFPATQGAYQTQFAGLDTALVGIPFGDAFIAKFGGSTASAVSIAGISNAASFVGGSIAPGEAVLIAGTGIGPATLTTAQCTTAACTNLSTDVANTQFTFNGVAAPVVYVSQQYSSVIVPYEVAGSSSAKVIATVNGVASPAFTVPVVQALPGVFTANSSGVGAAAVRNQDGSINSAQSPAPPGSIITLYLTGEGQTIPPGVDGLVTSSLNITPALSPVTVSFGEVAATNYAYVGEAPGVVAGVLQINVTVPPLAPTGNAVPITVNVGNFGTQNGVTVAIQ